MSEKNWKRSERRIASLLGGKRIPVTGRQRGDVPDVAHELFAVECKHKKALPGWLHEAMSQAKAAQRGEQLPVVVLHEAGQPHTQDLVVLRLADFRDWFGALPTGAAEELSDAA
jgi:hypothetical protein